MEFAKGNNKMDNLCTQVIFFLHYALTGFCRKSKQMLQLQLCANHHADNVGCHSFDRYRGMIYARVIAGFKCITGHAVIHKRVKMHAFL